MWSIYSHSDFSAGAKQLRRALGLKRYKVGDRNVINWGASSFPTTYKVILNNPFSVANAVNKVRALTIFNMSNVPTVSWTNNKDVSKRWIGLGDVVYCRKLITSSGGSGIVVATNINELVDCPLYTRGIEDASEYRVHVFKGKVIDVTKKMRPQGSSPNRFIRNHSNGWIFGRQGIDVPRTILVRSIQAVDVLGLDFGAVDILYKDGLSYVLEVNTAPGLEGTTLLKYINSFKEIL